MGFGGKVVVMLAVLLLAGALAHAQTALQSTDVVNVRSGPGTGYSIIGQVPSGNSYVGIEQSGSWWKIYYNGGTGWTYGGYYNTLSGTTGVKVTTDTLNVRSGPGTDYSIQGQVYMGQIYFWTEHADLGSWYKIYWGGTIGYVYDGYVTQVDLLGDSSSPPTSSAPSNLSMTHFYQGTNYFCGPTTAQMIINYLTGTVYSQWTLASYMGTTPDAGSSTQSIENAINAYAGYAYWVAYGFDRDKVVTNIQAYRPVNIDINTSYLAYWGYSYALHHSPIKGFTDGGFYIHDSYLGPDRWASSTEVWNAVNYLYGQYGVRY